MHDQKLVGIYIAIVLLSYIAKKLVIAMKTITTSFHTSTAGITKQ